MKAILPSILVFSFSLWGAEQKVVNFEDLQTQGKIGSQLYYLFNQDTPFTGKAVGFKYINGQKKFEHNYKDGKLSLDIGWYKSGQKKSEENYKDGKPHGLWTDWYENGQKRSEGKYKNGVIGLPNKGHHGLWTWWYESGQKMKEENWKDGKLMSTEAWKPNGEKCPVTNVKDGDGVGVRYNEDGTEKARYTYKDGELVD